MIKIPTCKSKCVLLASVSAAVIVCVTGVAVIKSQQPKPKLPEIISKVKNVKVLNAEVVGQTTSDAQVVLTVRNNMDKPIVAVAVESGDDKDAEGVNVHGFGASDAHPKTIIEPRGTYTLEMPLSYVRPGGVVKLGGVMYADGSEDGDEATLGTMRRQKEYHGSKKVR